ncbi:MAG: hypothetical protein WC782_15745 [Methylococcaceae bacterium]|jgi:hypothetical protein
MNNRKLVLQFVSIFLCLLPLIYPIAWNDNEFNYFGIAKHNIDPNPYSQLYAAYNGQFSRVVSDFTMGVFVKFLGFDNAWIVLRFVGLVGLSLVFTIFVNVLEISVIPCAAALLIFDGLGQTYFGAEWLFRGIEPKIFAYIFILIGFIYAYKNKLSVAIIYFALATYFHFLVGGFWSFAIFIYVYLANGFNKALIHKLCFYVISIAPLLAFLVYDNLSLPPPDTNGFSQTIDQIYSTIRNPHHVAPFDGDKLRSGWFRGWFYILLDMSILYVFYTSKCIYLRHRNFVLWTILLHAYLVIAIFIAYFDRYTQLLGKFYLFRPAALIFLLTLLIYCDIAFHYVSKIKLLNYALPVILAFFIAKPIYTGLTLDNLLSISKLYDLLTDDEKIVVGWLKNNTEDSNIILFEEGYNGSFSTESFEQLVGRPSLVNWKFVPTTKYAIARWYHLMLLKRAAYSGECSAFQQLPAKYYISFTESSNLNLNHCAKKAFSIGKYNIFNLQG